jgi:cytochrome oxidase assembly protein ShyY1
VNERRWTPGWRMTLLVAVSLPCLIGLGVWQLERAAQKHDYEALYFERMAAAPVPMPESLADIGFRRVVLTGTFDAEWHFLVDNQVHQGRPGYWVISAFRANDGRVWLVNRGWTAAPPRREALPGLITPADPVRITGVVWPDMGLVPLLGEDPWPSSWPKRVQRVDPERMAGTIGAAAPVEIRLEADQPGALVPAAAAHDFRAARHEGYAVQWFGLAGVLVIGYIIHGFRRHE